MNGKSPLPPFEKGGKDQPGLNGPPFEKGGKDRPGLNGPPFEKGGYGGICRRIDSLFLGGQFWVL